MYQSGRMNPSNFQCEKLQTFEGDLVTKQDNLKGSTRNTHFPLSGCLRLEEEIKNTYLTMKGRTVQDILGMQICEVATRLCKEQRRKKGEVLRGSLGNDRNKGSPSDEEEGSQSQNTALLECQEVEKCEGSKQLGTAKRRGKCGKEVLSECWQMVT